MTSPHPGMRNSAQWVRKLMFIGTKVGMVRADDLASGLGGCGRSIELMLDPVGRTGIDGQHVPVERSLRRDAHGRHEIDFFIGEGIEAAVGDVFECGPFMRGHFLAEGQHFPPIGVTR